MKLKYTTILIVLIISIITLLSCTKEFDIKEDFNYTLEVVKSSDSGYIYDGSAMTLNIKPERYVLGTTYKLSLKVTEGSGYIITANDSIRINVNDTYTIQKATSKEFKYYPTAIGINKILLTIEDNYGLVKTTEIEYKAIYSPFIFILTPNLSSYSLNQKGAITATIEQDKTTQFEIFYTVDNGKGLFYDDSGTLIPLEKNTPISVGTKTLNYVPSTIGTHQITATVIAPDGGSMTRKIDIIADNIPFTVSATPTGNSVNLNNTMDINLSVIQQSLTAITTYKMAYTFTDSAVTGVLKNEAGQEIPVGIYQDINLGTFKYNFKANAKGAAKITFKIKDANDQIKEAYVNLDVWDVTYTFTGATQNNSIYGSQSTAINFDITENVRSGNSYQMKYAILNGAGTIKNGLTIENSNTWYDVNTGSFNRTFVPSQFGPVKIQFTVRNTNNLVEKVVTIDITVLEADYTFYANSSTSETKTLQTPVVITLNLLQKGGNDDIYTLNYATTGIGTFLYNGITYQAGATIPFDKSVPYGTYTGQSAGKHDITFTSENQTKSTKTSICSITYSRNIFTLTTTGDASLYYKAETAAQVYIGQALPQDGISYQTKYSIASGSVGTGSINNNGNVIPFNTWTTTYAGANPINFKALGNGETNILVETKDSNGLERSSTLKFIVQPTVFNFTGETQTQLYVGEKEDINFNISENIESGSQYQISYRLDNGGATVYNNNTSIPPNVFSNINVGNYIMQIKPTLQGDTKITFTLRNIYSQEEKTITKEFYSYQKPKPINVYTKLHFWDRDNQSHRDNWKWNIYMEFSKDASATITSITLDILNNNNNIDHYGLDYSKVIIPDFEGRKGQNFKNEDYNSSMRDVYDNKPYTLTIRDSNGFQTTFEGYWINN